MQQHNAVKELEITHVAHTSEAQEKVTKIVDNNDNSKTTASKQDGSVLSVALATACVAAIALEAVAESQHKEQPEHHEVKLDNHDKIDHNRDSLGTEPAQIIQANQMTINEETVTENRTAKHTAEIALDESQVEIHKSRYAKSEVI